jgi:hypothetical protein
MFSSHTATETEVAIFKGRYLHFREDNSLLFWSKSILLRLAKLLQILERKKSGSDSGSFITQ